MADFGDGGAFPEIHVAQYPRDMGRPGGRGMSSSGGSSSSIVVVDVDESGKVRHDTIVKQGANSDKIVYSRLHNTREKEGDKETLAVPTEEEEATTAERTRLALDKITGGKVEGSTLKGALNQVLTKKEDSFVRYTPNPSAPGYNPDAKERVVRIVEAQCDPMEPPKHKYKKAPRAPADDPVPVLHSPPRKLTAADQAAWKIPACVSNWKNARGFTIPLDKRLATDGRGLQESTVSHGFATFSESLYIAERKAREETRLRGEMNKAMALKEKEAKEAELRELAMRARVERSGEAADGSPDERHSHAPASSESSDDEGVEQQLSGKRSHLVQPEGEDEEVAAQQRERLRHERKRDREREIRLENMKGDMKKRKMDRERDISEKIALGQLKGTGAGHRKGEGLYDSRLFNQSQGMDSGFGAEEDYNVYSKPMRSAATEATSIYRPKKDDGDTYGNADEQLKQLSDTRRFKVGLGLSVYLPISLSVMS